MRNKKSYLAIEVKESDDSPSENFKIFDSYLPGVQKIQLVKNLQQTKLSKSGILITPMCEWLAQMNF